MKKLVISTRARRKYGRSVNTAVKIFRAMVEEYKQKGVYVSIIAKFYRSKRNPKKYILLGRAKGYIKY